MRDDTTAENATVLVTGAAGFIGSNLVESLCRKGFRVRALDNFIVGRRKTLDELSQLYDFQVIEGDLRDTELCRVACRGCDFVMHEAALGSVPESLERPAEYAAVDELGTVHMLEAARLAKVKRFVFATSAAVYGDETNQPAVEERIGAPLSPYALAKWTNERWASLYTRAYGLETIGLRYFNVFGGRQDPNSPYAAVIPAFFKALLGGSTVTIFGDGAQTRDFVHVDDVVAANLRACLAPSAATGRVYNVARGESTSLLQLYNAITRLLGTSRPPRFAAERAGDIRHSRADISAARRLLGYEPSVSLDDGLARTQSWYERVFGSASRN